MQIPDYGEHYSYIREALRKPENAEQLWNELQKLVKNVQPDGKEIIIKWVRENLVNWDFNTYRWVLIEFTQYFRDSKNRND